MNFPSPYSNSLFIRVKYNIAVLECIWCCFQGQCVYSSKHKLLQMGSWDSVDMKISLMYLASILCVMQGFVSYQFLAYLQCRYSFPFSEFSLKGYVDIAPGILPHLQVEGSTWQTPFSKSFITLADSCKGPCYFPQVPVHVFLSYLLMYLQERTLLTKKLRTTESNILSKDS